MKPLVSLVPSATSSEQAGAVRATAPRTPPVTTTFGRKPVLSTSKVPSVTDDLDLDKSNHPRSEGTFAFPGRRTSGP
jgi:hypothetical protein